MKEWQLSRFRELRRVVWEATGGCIENLMLERTTKKCGINRTANGDFLGFHVFLGTVYLLMR
jgi:hypothetical protein